MISTKQLAVASIGASLLAIAATLPAYADYAPGPSDVVGVGGDTPQYDLGFLANGDVNGDLGFNSANLVNKWVPFDATADENGRQAYADGSTLASPALLNPTVTLRAGSSPVQRVASSGAAISALLADTGTPSVINYVSSASLPTAANQTTAGNNGWGYLHVVELGTDAVKIAADTTTNAPAGLSISDLLGIYTGQYTHWNEIPGNSSGSTAAIIPELPPSSSAIYKTFLADLKAANGGSTPALGSNVVFVEQNDPTAITGQGANAANAIVPFSAARLALYNAGYFHDPTKAFPGGSAITPGVKLLTGTPPESGSPTPYASTVTHYVIFRQKDLSSATPMEPGGSLNWAETLFSDPSGTTTPYVESGAGQALLAAAGITPHYEDLGNVSSG